MTYLIQHIRGDEILYSTHQTDFVVASLYYEDWLESRQDGDVVSMEVIDDVDND